MSEQLHFIHKYIPSEDPTNRTTVLLLHGTGGDEESLLPIVDIVSPDAVILSLRGQVLENGMPRFFKRISEGVFDLEDLKLRTRELASFIEASGQIYGLESNEVIALGYSNGANIASSVMLTYPALISRAVLYHPMIPFVPANSPDLSKAKILITAGTNDPIVSSDETIELHKMFQDYGADVEIFWHDQGHNLTREELDKTTSFLSES
ncbi:MAG: alpha/beta hydrolase [Thermodesulfobacteriales bacterium]|nr:MAG: alpha/beta hydrolase [Thermodesulfobacteriales bacterium]